MKKIFFGLILFVLLTVNVFAEHEKAIVKNYVVEIEGKRYSVAVSYAPRTAIIDGKEQTVYEFSDPSRFSDTVRVYDEGGKEVSNYINIEFRYPDFIDIIHATAFDMPRYTFIAEDIFLDDERMKDFLPKFVFVDGKMFWYTYTTDEAFLERFKGNCWNDGNKWNELDWKQIIDLMDSHGYISNSNVEPAFGEIVHYLGDIERGDESWVNTEYQTKEALVKVGKELNDLLDIASDINVCTHDDLEAIRTQRDLLFLHLKDDFDATLSSECYSILFGDAKIYSKTIIARDLLTTYLYGDDEDYNFGYTMGSYYLESAYFRSMALLTGIEMKHEIKEVVRCSMFGPKTVEFLQSIFNVFKFLGVIVGSLLITVDVFKAIVGKEDAVKKNFGVLLKRIGAMVVLILLPFVVEIIFELVNTIGVTDPICGIR